MASGEPRVTAADARRILAPADNPRRPGDRGGAWRGALLSFLLHAAIIAALLGLWRLPAPHEIVLQVALVEEGPGAAGAAGGAGGKAATPSEAAMAAPAEAPTAPSVTPPTAQTAEASLPAPAPMPAPPLKAPAPPAPMAAPAKPPPPRPHHKPAPPARPAEVTAAAEPAPPTPAPAAVSSPPPLTDRAATAAPAAAGIGQGPAGPSGVGQGAEGQGHGVVGDGPQEGPGDDYLDRLRRWLAKYKKYPEEALKQKMEGKVLVAFTLARDGTVLSAWVEKGSGSTILDHAAVQMLHDASPVPPVPERYKGRLLRITIPVDYSIGFFERLFR